MEKLIFVVAGSKRGLGGHHFSVRDIAETAHPYYKAEVVQVGAKHNPAFESLQSNFTFFKVCLHRPLSISRALKRFRKFAREPAIGFIAFDYFSLALIRLASCGLSNPCILCKPGGKNWPIRTKNIPAVLLFSRENFAYLRSKQPELAKRAVLIQGRVKGLSASNPAAHLELKPFRFSKKIICVARFAPEKKCIFDRSITFFERYYADAEDACLLLIGLPSHPEVVAYVQAQVKRSITSHKIFILTTAEYYQNASRFFSSAEFLVGNGRTVIEALSCGTPALVAIDSREYPVLLTRESVDALVYWNLSTRSILDGDTYDSSLKRTEHALSNQTMWESLSKDSLALFQSEFSILKCQQDILNCVEIARSNAKEIELELNDLRMFLVGLIGLNYPGLYSATLGALKKRYRSLRSQNSKKQFL